MKTARFCESCGQRIPEPRPGTRIADGEFVRWSHLSKTLSQHSGTVVGMIVREHRHRNATVPHRFYRVEDEFRRILTPPAGTIESANPHARRVALDP